MNFNVLQKPFEYEGCPIIIRQFGESFEYITCINNQIFSAFLIARKTIMQRILMRDYTKEQLTAISNRVIAMAQTTINTVKGLQESHETSA